MTQIRVFSEAYHQRCLAQRADLIQDLAIAFHAKGKDRQAFIKQLEVLSGGR
jgi:hypothetical protein